MAWGNYDIGQDGLAWALAHCPVREKLEALVLLARTHFGWFSRQPSRVFEYPWVLGEIGQIHGKPLLDVGTGISPLPVLLAEQGARVVTVDNSRVVRRLDEDRTSWTGWGFLDYSCINRNLRSLNEDVLSVDFPDRAFAGIYSVSVIEHLPSLARRQFWGRAAKWIDTSGVLLLTVDLTPGTDQLWNCCNQKTVESAEEHGDLAMLKKELQDAGFQVAAVEVLRQLRNSDADCALLRLQRSRRGMHD